MYSYSDCISCDGLKCTVWTGPLKTNSVVVWNDNLSRFESLKPIIKTTEVKYWCPNCEALLNIYDKYCHECGEQLDWEGVC